MKPQSSSLSVSALLLVATAVSGNCQSANGPAAQVQPSTREVGSGGVIYQVLVTSSESWSPAKNAAWIALSKSNGFRDSNLEITVEPNPGNADRSATVTIGGGTHTVTQRGTGAALQELWAVGSDFDGQLGDNRLLRRFAPVPVASRVRQAVGGSMDAALRISLPAGAYTVQVAGVGNATGDGMVELYELPP